MKIKNTNDTMRKEYDFSAMKGGVRGKFYRPGTKLAFPVHSGHGDYTKERRTTLAGVSLHEAVAEHRTECDHQLRLKP